MTQRPTKIKPAVARALRSQGGWGLVETLLTLGALTAMSAGIYLALRPASATAQVKAEQDNLHQLSQAIDRSFGVLGTFDGVSAAKVLAADLAPTKMAQGGALRTQWGAPITIAPHAVAAAGDSFVVTYPGVSAEVCARLAAAVSREAFDIRVGGQSVYTANGLDPALATQRCAGGNATMAFVYHSGLVAGQAVAAAPMTLPPGVPGVAPPPSTPGSNTIASSPGVAPAAGVSPVIVPPAVIGTVPPPTITAPPPPATVTPPPPPPAPTLPTLPPTITACAPPASWVDTQTRAPNCVAGQFGRLEQLREGHHNYSCPEAWDAPVDSFDVTGWQPWTTTLQTCASCPAPEVETEKRWAADFTLANCPAGQYGTTAHQRDQERTRDKTYNCPAGTIVLPAPDYTSWSAWANTGATRQVSSACTTCPPVAPQTEVQWQATAPNCPAGQYGARSWEYEQSRQRTGSHNCPAGTATLPAITWAPWGAWSNTGATRNSVNTCANCPAPSTQTETNWLSTAPNCPAGQYGTRSWEYEQSRSRSVTTSCPAGTTVLPAPTYSAWSAWANTGATRNSVNTCANCPAPSTQTQERWLSTAPNCPAGQYGARSWEYEQSRSRSVTTSCPAGTTVLPAPTYGSWSAYANTGATRNSVNTCANCPAPATVSETQWAPASASCPAGQSGSHTWEKQQTRNRTRSYNCPAATLVLPAPSYTTWSAWADTGATRNVVNTCAPTSCGSWTMSLVSLAPNFDSLRGEYISFNDGAGVTCSAGWGWGLSPGTPATQADKDAYEACNALWLATPNPRGPGAKYLFEEYSDWGGVAVNLYVYVGPNTCP